MRPRAAEKQTRGPGAPPKEDRFRFGWRDVPRRSPDGRSEWERIPLTLRDALFPQVGDHIVQSFRHDLECYYLAGVARSRVSRLRRGKITSDNGADWHLEGVAPVCPDLGVFDHLRSEPPPESAVLDVIAQGARSLTIVEIVSPNTRENDVGARFVIYHRAGVRQYVIVDQEREGGPREVQGHRWTRSRYVRMRPDEHGRIPIKSLGISLGLEDNRLWAYDLETGERIPDTPELTRRLETAESDLAEQQRQNAAAAERIRQLEADLRRARGAAE